MTAYSELTQAKKTMVDNLLAQKYGYQDEIEEGVPNPESKHEFVVYQFGVQMVQQAKRQRRQNLLELANEQIESEIN